MCRSVYRIPVAPTDRVWRAGSSRCRRPGPDWDSVTRTRKKTQTNLEAEMGLLGRKQCWAELCCLLVMSCWDENWRELSGLLFLPLERGSYLSTDVGPRIGKRAWKVQSVQQPVGRQAGNCLHYGVRIGAVEFRQGHLLRVKMLLRWWGPVAHPRYFAAALCHGGLPACRSPIPRLDWPQLVRPRFHARITADIHLR